MAKGKSTTIIIIVIAVVLVAIIGVVLFYLNGDSVKTRTMVQISKDGKVVAEITDAGYTYNLINLMLYFQEANGITDATKINEFWNTTYEGVTQLDQVKSFALEQIKTKKVEYLKAIENGTKLSDTEKADLKASFDTLEKQFADSDTKIEDYLVTNYRISYKMYKQFSEDNKIAAKFSIQQINNIVVTEDEVKAYYDTNIAKYYTVTVRHILLTNKDADGNTLDETALKAKKDLADSILVRVNEDEDMDALVTQYSEDTGVSDNKGYYDVTANSGYVKEFQDWTMKSKVGDTAVIETDFGYHVMKTYAISTYDSDQLQVKKDLQTSKYSEIISGWAEEYNIEVFDSVYASINPLR